MVNCLIYLFAFTKKKNDCIENKKILFHQLQAERLHRYAVPADEYATMTRH